MDSKNKVEKMMNAGHYNTKAKQGKAADKDGNQLDFVRNVQKYRFLHENNFNCCTSRSVIMHYNLILSYYRQASLTTTQILRDGPASKIHKHIIALHALQ